MKLLFILTMQATISARPFFDEDVPLRKVRLGCLVFYLIRVEAAINERVHMDDLFDSYQETMDAARAIFDTSFEEFRPAVQTMFANAIPSPSDDILLLHRLTVHPLARGQQIGLWVLHRAIRDWSSGCPLVVIKPFPLQFEDGAKEKPSWNDLRLGDFPTHKAAALGRLTKYYKRLGFERLGRTEFFAICPHMRFPFAQELQIPVTFSIPAPLLSGS